MLLFLDKAGLQYHEIYHVYHGIYLIRYALRKGVLPAGYSVFV